MKLATGRSYYLQLCAPPDKQEQLFGHWEELIDLLRPPVEAYSSTHAVPAGYRFLSMFEEMDRRGPDAEHFHGPERQGEVSTGSIHVLEATAALSAASDVGQPTRQDFHRCTTMPKEAAPDNTPAWHVRESAERAKREEVTAEEPVARAVTHGADGVAEGTMAGALNMTATKSALKQLTRTLAGAAAECPGGRKNNPTISSVANTCPPSAPTLLREQAGRQLRLSLASTEAPTGRRESTQEGAIRSSPPRTPTPAASCQRAGGEKIPHQPGDSTSGSLRAPREQEEGRRSSAHSRHDTTCKEVNPAHAPTAEESRASHKLGGTKSAHSWPEIHGRIGSLWHNIKARVSGRTQPQRGGHPGQDPLGDHHKEDSQGLQVAGSRPWARSHREDQG